MTRTLDHIRFVTRHFNDLQGLSYWVPLGLITLSLGGAVYFDNPGFLILRAVLFLGAFVMAAVARWYYKRMFGEVEPQSVYPARELQTLSIYSPAGPTPRLGGFQRMSPMVRSVLIPLGLTVVLFSVLQATRPILIIDEDESLVQPPWTTLSVVYFQEEGAGPAHWQAASRRRSPDPGLNGYELVHRPRAVCDHLVDGAVRCPAHRHAAGVRGGLQQRLAWGAGAAADADENHHHHDRNMCSVDGGVLADSQRLRQFPARPICRAG